MNEIEKLEKQGKISARDHQILRSSQLAQDELMNLTLGDEDALTEETITETLRRVTENIKKEENDRYRTERARHEQTLKELAGERERWRLVQERLYWRCRRDANVCAWIASIGIVALLIGGFAFGAGFRATNPIFGWLLMIAVVVFTLWTLVNMVFGTTVKNFHSAVATRVSTWLIQRKAVALGLDAAELK